LIVIVAGIWGIVVYIGVQVIGHLLESSDDETSEEQASGKSTNLLKQVLVVSFILKF
jgi:hypothetical protein